MTRCAGEHSNPEETASAEEGQGHVRVASGHPRTLSPVQMPLGDAGDTETFSGEEDPWERTDTRLLGGKWLG